MECRYECYQLYVATYLLAGNLEKVVDELDPAVLKLNLVGLRNLGREVLGSLNLCLR